jgi:hypothetical protein
MGCGLFLPQKIVFRSNQGGQLWRSTFAGRTLPVQKRLAEAHNDAVREALLKLLADEG